MNIPRELQINKLKLINIPSELQIFKILEIIVSKRATFPPRWHFALSDLTRMSDLKAIF